MRAKFLLVPAALIATMPAMAADNLTLEQAQQILFPGGSFTPLAFRLNDKMARMVEDAAEVSVWNRDVKAWYVSGGGLLFVDLVPGRDDFITYALALDDKGAIKGIEILECLPHYDQITSPSWRAQFSGKQHGAIKRQDITEISGTTMSSVNITKGVLRLLAIYAVIMNRPAP